MIPIDLITGFLGAGKTTFLRRYVQYWMSKGCRVGILENDFGAINVDMMLLQDLIGDQCDIEMVVGGYDVECHQRRTKAKLVSMGMLGFDRIIVEPSGIYDADEFFDVLHNEPLDRWYEIGNVIAIVGADLEETLSAQSEYLLAAQVAAAGQLILSRTQEVSAERTAQTLEHIERTIKTFGARRQLTENICLKPWDELTDSDFEAFAHSGCRKEHPIKLWFNQDEVFGSLYYMNYRPTEQELTSMVESMMQDKQCGNVLRVKGFFKGEQGSWFELNATPEKRSIQPIAEGQEVFIVIGEALNEARINAYFGALPKG